MDEVMNRILDMMSNAGPYAFWAGLLYMALYFLVTPTAVIIGIWMVGRAVERFGWECSDWPELQKAAGTNFSYPLYRSEKARIISLLADEEPS